jgi:predicted DNA-binding transcriptional regulator AlpA
MSKSPKDLLKRFVDRQQDPLRRVPNLRVIADSKARQSAKIRQLGEALVAAGYHRLDEQAKVLGLSRSTTWTLLKANHKNSGLSAAVINRMLAAPDLPPRVKLTIVEYIAEKSAGLYGDGETRARRFTARITSKPNNRLGSP